MRAVGVAVFVHLHDDSVLLYLPLFGHLGIKGIGDFPVELVDIHGLHAPLEPVIFGPQLFHGRLVFLLFVGVAFMQGLGDPRQNVVAESQAAENFCEFLLDHLLTYIGLRAFPPEAGAMVIDVAALLELPDQGAAAMAAIHQASERKVALGPAYLARIAAIEHALHTLP